MTDDLPPVDTRDRRPESGDQGPGDAGPSMVHGSSASRWLQNVPVLSELPSWAAILVTLGLASVAVLVSLQLLELGLVVLYRGLGGLLTVLLVALVLAYLLDPVIDRFERGGWNRTAAIGLALGLFLAINTLAFLFLVPYVVTEVSDLTENMDTYVSELGDRGEALEQWVSVTTGRDLDLRFSAMVDKLPALLEKMPLDRIDPVRVVAQKLVGSTFGLLGFLVQWLLLPIFLFFFLRDFDTMKSRAFDLVPYRFRRVTLDHYVAIDEKMSLFIRGQLLLCMVLSVLYALGLGLFTDIDLAVLLGVVSGALFIIPYFGTFLGIVVGTMLAVLKFGFTIEVFKVWAVYGVVQGIEGALLTPKIVGDSVGLHPVVVVLALVAGGNLFGFLGILLAVPLAAAAQVLIGTAISHYQSTDWFQSGRDDAPEAEDLP
ncbi:MAG TPA: hypothetical protein DIU15_13760 [Deltaproteobacteria bacterium]|nr:hypothetical protein [Deltaproteobacteria bacterium]HCP47106.1 hypothetical protein [Deltaproteobacteria bacterium]